MSTTACSRLRDSTSSRSAQLAFGDVVPDVGKTGPAAHLHRTVADDAIAQAAILAAVATLEAHAARRGRRDSNLGPGLLVVRVGLDVGHAQAGKFIPRVAQSFAGRIVEFGKREGFDIDQQHAFHGAIDDGAEYLLTLAQTGLRGLARRHVAPDADHVIATVQLHHAGAESHIKDAAVLATMPRIELAPTGLQQVRNRSGKRRLVEVHLYRQQRLANQLFAPITKHATGRVIDFDEAQRHRIDQIDAVARLADDGAKDFLAFHQRVLRTNLGRNIAKAPDACLHASLLERPGVARKNPSVLEQQGIAGFGVAAVELAHPGHEALGIDQLVQHMGQQGIISGIRKLFGDMPEFPEALVGRQHGTVQIDHQDAFVGGVERHPQAGFGPRQVAGEVGLLLPAQFHKQTVQQERGWPEPPRPAATRPVIR